MNDIVTEVHNLTPYVLVVGDSGSPQQCFFVVDKKVISEVPNIDDLPFCLMSAFFVFNISYPIGCTNFYTFMEVIVLNYPLKKASLTVKHLFASFNV